MVKLDRLRRGVDGRRERPFEAHRIGTDQATIIVFVPVAVHRVRQAVAAVKYGAVDQRHTTPDVEVEGRLGIARHHHVVEGGHCRTPHADAHLPDTAYGLGAGGVERQYSVVDQRAGQQKCVYGRTAHGVRTPRHHGQPAGLHRKRIGAGAAPTVQPSARHRQRLHGAVVGQGDSVAHLHHKIVGARAQVGWRRRCATAIGLRVPDAGLVEGATPYRVVGSGPDPLPNQEQKAKQSECS